MPHACSRPFLVALAVAALAGAPASASAATSAPTIPAAASSVSAGVCTTSATDPVGRAASFTVRMRDVPPTSSFGFSLQLEERASGGRWSALRGSAAPPGFGVLVAARSGSSRLVRKINVQGLRPGSRYRLRVSYRWSSAGGGRGTERVGRPCLVKDVRPNVGVTGEFGWQPSTSGGEVAYRIGVASTGLGLLRSIDVPVVVRQGDTVLASGTFRPSTATEPVLVPGKRCVQGTPVVVQLDPQALLPDRDPGDNELRAQCVPVS